MDENKIQIEVEFEDGRKGFAYLKSESKRTGEEAGDEFGTQFSRRIKSSLTAVSAALAGLGLVGLFRKSIQEAIEQEQANKRLEDSLRRVGGLTQANLTYLQEQADLLSKTTKLTDDQAASLLALANNYAGSSTQAAALVKASTDLAAATGVDVNQAVEALGLSLNGVGRGLNRLIPGFSETKKEALEAGAALKFVQDNFAGSAEAQYTGIGASLSKVSKAFSEVAESAGFFISRSIDFGAIAKTIASSLESVSNFLNNTSMSIEDVVVRLGRLAAAFAVAYVAMNPSKVGGAISDFLAGIVTQFIATAQQTGSLGAAIKATFLSGELAVKGFQLAVTGAKAALTLGLTLALDYLITRFLELKNQGVGTMDALKSVFLTIGEFALNAVGAVLTGIQALLEALPMVGGTLASGLQVGIDKIGEASLALSNMNAQLVSSATATRDIALATSEASVATSDYTNRLSDADTKLKQTADVALQVAQTFKSALVSGISNGVQTIVKSLAAGKFSFDMFGKLLLGIIGNIAIQIGTTLVGIGIAVEALKTSLLTLTGGPAIAAGIALIAIGALLSSLSAGGEDTANVQSGGGVAGGGGVAAVAPVTAAEEERQARGTEVVVNVEGNVFNGREQAQLIAENLQEYFDTNNGLLVRS